MTSTSKYYVRSYKLLSSNSSLIFWYFSLLNGKLLIFISLKNNFFHFDTFQRELKYIHPNLYYNLVSYSNQFFSSFLTIDAIVPKLGCLQKLLHFYFKLNICYSFVTLMILNNINFFYCWREITKIYLPILLKDFRIDITSLETC